MTIFLYITSIYLKWIRSVSKLVISQLSLAESGSSHYIRNAEQFRSVTSEGLVTLTERGLNICPGII
jgi:hypothetical protein